ncbi:MAG: T9SS type A sorting domain-containing protein [Saprospiraceae bacterium]|nr:T9SS type A sorting domain-containing protein [Saprospiraceae bacterium]
MKKLISALLLIAFAAPLFAQPQVKKYVMIEHFTNSRCSICASRNPAFFNLIDDYPQDVHHIAVHPPVPYNNCVFYLANTADNITMANEYGINGTPRVALNGTLINAGNPLLPTATLESYLNQTSPLYVKVEDLGTGANRTAAITLRNSGGIPAGDYTLYAAALEKTINQTTPNGESVHHNVLRDLITAGIDLAPLALGEEISINLGYTIQNGWNADEMYVLAWVRNNDTKAILNSGTRFDPILVSTQTPHVESVKAWPNPATEETFIQTADESISAVQLFGADGRSHRVAFSQTNNQVRLDVKVLPAGLYYIRLQGETKTYTGKLVKQ